MALPKKKWITYGSKAKYINIGVKDSFKQTLESFELEKGRERDIKRAIDKIENSYGFRIIFKKPKKQEN